MLAMQDELTRLLTISVIRMRAVKAIAVAVKSTQIYMLVVAVAVAVVGVAVLGLDLCAADLELPRAKVSLTCLKV
jgi:hypothetical protein